MPPSTTILQNQSNNWVVFSASNWNDLQVSNHFISQELASKGNKVFYLESPGVIGLNPKRILNIFRNYFFNKIFGKDILNPRKDKSSDQLESNLKIIKKIPLPILGLPFIDYLILFLFLKNNKQIFSLISNADNILICSPIWIKFFNNFEGKYYKKDKLKIYYHLVDDVESYNHLFFYLKDFKYFISKIDGLISPNEKLLSKYSKFNKLTFCLPHGFKKVLNKRVYLYNDFKRDKSIVYAGTFADWCDFDLIRKICVEFKDIKVYLIGRPAKNVSNKFLNKLRKIFKNLIIKDSLGRYDLHQFLLKCSVSIIPYKEDNFHIQYSSPSKIMDYLGCGLPVISTYIPYCKYHPFVETTKNHEEFLLMIRKRLYIDDNERISMINYALENQWVHNVNNLCKSL